jgi:hypothetical protein
LFRILDSETRLLERADQKATALLSMLGVFMVFFVVYWRVLPVNPILVAMVVIYLALALFAILRLIGVLRPRMQELSPEAKKQDELAGSEDPTFFGGIIRFPNPRAYREYLTELADDPERLIAVYSRHIYNVSLLNQVKYRNVRQGSLLVILALAVELLIIGYTFSYHMHGVPGIGA